MCVVSMVGDQFGKTVPDRHPWTQPYTKPFPTPTDLLPPTRKEFEDLRKEIQELKLLLQATKRFDEQTGQPDCHMDEKVALIKRLAELVGVDMEEVFE